MRVRRAKAADVPAMMKLERETASAAHWAQQYYDGLFLSGLDRRASERFAWVAEEGQGSQPDENLETEPRVRGFLVARRTNDEYELENLAVSTEMRRKGIGTMLVTQLLAQSRETHASGVFLEVRESNRSARVLYEKLGFEKVGLRKNYYSRPQDNAVLYRFNLC